MRAEEEPEGIIAHVVRYELIIVLAVAPLMLFPNRASIAGLVVVALVWLARWVAYKRLTRPSAMNAPELLLIAMALIGYFISIDRQLSEPKLWGIFLQAVLFFSVLNGLHNRRDIDWLTWGIVALTAGTALASLVGTQWDIVRLASFPGIYDRLPQLIRGLPDSGLSPAQDLFHPREVGAAMGMLLPFITTLLLFARSRWLRLASGLTLLLGGFVLILSQALMGLFGLLVGWAIIAVWWRRWMIIPVILAGLAVLGLAWAIAPDNWLSLMLSVDNPYGIAVVLRLDMWSRALAMIADMPYTGIGLNTFPLIQSHFYIGHLLGAEPHAHNLLLQTAVDLGFPGLIALFWLSAAFYMTAWRVAARLEDRALTALVIGAVAGVTAYIAGGALDVMTLGAKPVAALSLFIGLVGALRWLTAEVDQPAEEGSPRNRQASRFVGLAMPAVLILIFVLSVAVWPAKVNTNWALIPAHQAIYAARQTGRLPEASSTQALELLPGAIQQEPDNPELYGIYGTLLAWNEQPAAAIQALAQRVDLDSREPLRYAPFLAWQRESLGQEEPDNGQLLLKIYQQWQARFPERADLHALVSLVYERQLGAVDQAAAVQRQALTEGAAPRTLLEFYYQMLLGESTGHD